MWNINLLWESDFYPIEMAPPTNYCQSLVDRLRGQYLLELYKRFFLPFKYGIVILTNLWDWKEYTFSKETDERYIKEWRGFF